VSTLDAIGVLETVQESPADVNFDREGVAEIKENKLRGQKPQPVRG
jgi:hypothetical protein